MEISYTNRCAIPAFFTKDILFYTTNKIDRIAVSLFIAEAWRSSLYLWAKENISPIGFEPITHGNLAVRLLNVGSEGFEP